MAAMAAILKIYFLLLLNQRPIDSKLARKHQDDVDQKQLKSCRLEIQDGRHGRSLLTPNLVGGIGVTYRSKIAKIVPIGNPRWPPWQPS